VQHANQKPRLALFSLAPSVIKTQGMTESTLTSRDNPVFKRLKKLADSARARRDVRMTLLDSEHLVTAYLDAGGQPVTLIRAASYEPARLSALAQRGRQVKLIVLPDALFAELTPVITPTGVLAEAAWLEPAPLGNVPLVIVLENIQDPGNLGAMLRTGAAAGATLAVLSATCHDPWSPKALRGGQGAQFVLPLQMGVNLPDWLIAFKGLSVALSLDTLPSAENNFYQLNLSGAIALVVGNEGAGLSEKVAQAAHFRTRIPMPGKVESLNAAAALAVATFEAVRQRELLISQRSPHENT
jgi:TrmH family RNA methyltransferase